MIPRPSHVFPCRATARSSSTPSACGTLPGTPAPNHATPSSFPSRAATPSTNGSRASRSHFRPLSLCVGTRFIASAPDQYPHGADARGGRDESRPYTHARRAGRQLPPGPSCQGEEEEKEVVLCFL